MTFLGGGRSCVGFKFSQLEMSECDIHFVIRVSSYMLRRASALGFVVVFSFHPFRRGVLESVNLHLSHCRSPKLDTRNDSQGGAPVTVVVHSLRLSSNHCFNCTQRRSLHAQPIPFVRVHTLFINLIGVLVDIPFLVHERMSCVQ